MLQQALSEWVKPLFSPTHGRRRPRPKKRPARLALEPLEERCVPVVYNVASLADVPPSVLPGAGFDGVVQVRFASPADSGSCTGSLLFTGRHILTAAHCVDLNENGRVDAGGMASVSFDMPTGRADMPTQRITLRNIPSSAITVHPDWDGRAPHGDDIAIIRLPEIAPAGAERYQIYRDTDELGQIFTLVGYGRWGTGSTGDSEFGGVKRLGFNVYDEIGRFRRDTALVYDFDSGSRRDDRMGDRGLGALEAFSGRGDSGGPSFIDGRIAAVTSFVRDRRPLRTPVSGFGDVGFNTRVSRYADWIDGLVAGPYHLVVDMENQPGGNDGRFDRIAVDNVAGTLSLFINGSLVHRDAMSNILRITLRGSGDNETFALGHYGVPVAVDGRGGRDTIILAGTPDGDTIGLLAGVATLNDQAVSYSNLEGLTVDARGGPDEVFVIATAAATPITVMAGSGSDRIHVGSLVNRVDSIQGGVTIFGDLGVDELHFNDQREAGPRTYDLTGERLFRFPADVRYFGVENVVVQASRGPDIIQVRDLGAGISLTVNGNEGGDFFFIATDTSSLDDIDGTLRLQGLDGADQLIVNDRGAAAGHDYQIRSASLSRVGGPAITFDAMAELQLTGTRHDDRFELIEHPGRSEQRRHLDDPLHQPRQCLRDGGHHDRLSRRR